MTACNSHFHPQVPVTCVTVTVVYCHQCDAFVLYSGRSTSLADELQAEEEFSTVEYGPFDTVVSVLQDALTALNYHLVGAGRPWDARWSQNDVERP